MLSSSHAPRPQPHRAARKATVGRQRNQRAGHNAPTSPRMIVALDRRSAALDMRRRGASFREIASALGLSSPGNAYRLVRDELAELRGQCSESAAELRALEAERLDMLWRALMPAVEAGDVRAVIACVAICKRRCALFGLDRPTPEPTSAAVKLYAVLDASPDCPDWPSRELRKGALGDPTAPL